MSTILMSKKGKYKNTDTVLEHITKKIVDIVDLDGICKLHPDKRIEKLYRIIKKLVDEEKIVISEKNISVLVKQIYEETFEFGPISNLMKDDSVSEIMVNSWNDIYIEVCGCLEKTEITFKNEMNSTLEIWLKG
jgi:pilus assembly protein CpaF